MRVGRSPGSLGVRVHGADERRANDRGAQVDAALEAGCQAGLRMGRDILRNTAACFAKESGAIPGGDTAFMKKNQARCPRAVMCRVWLGFSPSGYYDWAVAPAVGAGDATPSSRQESWLSGSRAARPTTPAGSTRRSATSRRRTSRDLTMRPEANLSRRGGRSVAGSSGPLASQDSLVAALHRWRGERRSHIRHHHNPKK